MPLHFRPRQSPLLTRLPSSLALSLPAPTTTAHLLTYLLALVLPSISLLVFLNSTISFVVTDILGIRYGPHKKPILGDIVGTLGLVDEIVVIVAAPLWGILSDRWSKGGRKGVSVVGFLVTAAGLVGLSEAGLVKGKHSNGNPIQLEGWEWWYWLVWWRAVFALGAAAISTMISAVLPDLTSPLLLPNSPTPPPRSFPRHTPTLPAYLSLHRPLPPSAPRPSPPSHAPPNLPIIQTCRHRVGLKRAYWLVATYAVVCGTACWFGLPHYARDLPSRWTRSRSGSRGRGRGPLQRETIITKFSRLWRAVSRKRDASVQEVEAERLLSEDQEQQAGEQDILQQRKGDGIVKPGMIKMFVRALRTGYDRWRTIGISYIGGFIARASSVGLSLFIPLFVNHYFISHDLCDPNKDPLEKPHGPRSCPEAYLLSSALTGISQLTALLCAPVIGYLSASTDSSFPHPATSPLRVLSVTSVLGLIGFIGFGLLETPKITFASAIFAALIGVGQIGAVVGSLGLLGRGQGEEFDSDPEPREVDHLSDGEEGEEERDDRPARFLSGSNIDENPGELKGSIAGVYSLCGGAGILLLTKGGGLLFDKWTPGAPFWILGVFMGVLALVTGWEGWVRG
ncbi:hypothetical protein BDZ91DRAFT_846474 [Kalaharituber pfeilii]|nr:hypothetical protein BDZ91DRAFT_846474 [Kalaharituber pfeilii]